MESPLTPKEPNTAREPAPRRREAALAIALASFAWLVCVLAFKEGDVVLLAGTAVVCALSGVAMHRRGVPTGLFMVITALPWMVVQQHRLAAALAQDMKDHRWTAYTFDGALGPVVISAKGLISCSVAWMIARLISSMVPTRNAGT